MHTQQSTFVRHPCHSLNSHKQRNIQTTVDLNTSTKAVKMHGRTETDEAATPLAEKKIVLC